MKTLVLRFALSSLILTTLVLNSSAALAQEHGEDEGAGGGGTSFVGGPDWDSVKEVTIWSIVSIGTVSVLLGVLYLFKRKIGAFPANPTWVAPISIMPAGELPGDDDDAGHGVHDTHAPAH